MKKIFILAFIPFFVFASKNKNEEIIMQKNIKELERMNMPTPDSGIKIVSEEKLYGSDWRMSRDAEELQEQIKKGFVEKDSQSAYDLLHFEERQKKIENYFKSKGLANKNDLRDSHREIKMAYTFNNIEDASIKSKGFAPSGVYIKDFKNEGWSGIGWFFDYENNSCHYIENNLNLSHGAAWISEKEATTDVNGKITAIKVYGTNSSGYSYHVQWFTNDFIKSLECANHEYNKSILKSVINMASKIDNG